MKPDWLAPKEYALIMRKLPILIRTPIMMAKGIIFRSKTELFVGKKKCNVSITIAPTTDAIALIRNIGEFIGKNLDIVWYTTNNKGVKIAKILQSIYPL